MRQVIATIMDLLAKGNIDKATAGELVRALQAAPVTTPSQPSNTGDIAIIGVAAQLPGTSSVDDFWAGLLNGEDFVRPLPDRRRQLCAPVVPAGSVGDYLTGAWLEGIDEFDAEFFGITPADARSMDPQHRRFFETAYHCWEDAGWAGRIRGTETGVYVAVADGDYAEADTNVSASSVPGRVTSFAASRLSFRYDLSGPAYTVSSTCSSSLVALHDACLGLRAGDCELALVGGINIFSFPVSAENWLMDQSGIMSPTARCRPFAAGGDGIGRGEGVVAFLLKPLYKATADGDRVRAVIKSTAVNNDGTSAALTAPNSRAHTELLDRAWQRAGISPETLSYIETHGTGTELGDPIEIRGITDAIRRHTARRQFLPVGSVKGNIGHLMDGSAGLSGLLKALLVLEHQIVPPTAGLDVPNEHIDFLDSPVFVPTTPWTLKAAGSPLRAGVSCFGFNGTNVHAVLEEAPTREGLADRTYEELLFPVSASTPAALQRLLARHGRYASSDHPVDVAHTLTVGREHLEHRVAIKARTTEEFRSQCAKLSATEPSDWGPPATSDAVSYVNGGVITWTGGTAAIVSLPDYPFEPISYWLPAAAASAEVASHVPAPATDYPLDTLGRCIVVVEQTLGYFDLNASDNFLALGGSSLAALQVQSTFLKAFGWEVPLVEILAADDFLTLSTAIDDLLLGTTPVLGGTP